MEYWLLQRTRKVIGGVEVAEDMVVAVMEDVVVAVMEDAVVAVIEDVVGGELWNWKGSWTQWTACSISHVYSLTV